MRSKWKGVKEIVWNKQNRLVRYVKEKVTRLCGFISKCVSYTLKSTLLIDLFKFVIVAIRLAKITTAIFV